MGSTKVSAPGPSAAEQELQKEQLNLLRGQKAEMEMLRPYLLQSMGYKQEGDTLRPMTEDEKLEAMSPDERLAAGNYKLQLERQQQALEGKLPISPALEQELGKQQMMTNEELSRRLGPNWQQSTAGIQTAGDFNQRANLLREEARQGAISQSTGLALSQMGGLMGYQGQQQNMYNAFPNRGMGLLQGYGTAMQPYQFDRNMQFQAGMQSAANKAGLYSGLMGLAGTGIGMGAMGYFSRPPQQPVISGWGGLARG